MPSCFDGFKVANEIQAASVLSSRNLHRTLNSLPSSVDVLLLEDVLDDQGSVDLEDNNDIDDTTDQRKDRPEEKNICTKDEAKDSSGEKNDVEEDDDDGPLFALYCGGETSVIAGLGQENGYYQVKQRKIDINTRSNKSLPQFLAKLWC